MTSKKRRRRWERRGLLSAFDQRLLLRIVLVGLGSFLLGYLMVALLFFPRGGGAAVVAVPELRELPLNEARSRLASVGLLVELGDSLPNPEVAEGAVLAQSPLPGTEVQPGSGVRLIVSAGRERRAVVDVGTMAQAQAQRVLEALGFEVVVDSVPARRAAGRVVSTDPPAGTTLPVPSTVRLTVSSGPPRVAVPNVVGLLEHDARQALEEMGFAVGSVEYEYRFDELGSVIAQSPAAGDSLALGEPVDLRVATDQWRQPDW